MKLQVLVEAELNPRGGQRRPNNTHISPMPANADSSDLQRGIGPMNSSLSVGKSISTFVMVFGDLSLVRCYQFKPRHNWDRQRVPPSWIDYGQQRVAMSYIPCA